MKTTTDKLFRLIKAMSPAEKRYYKRHFGPDTNILTHLFDAINLQKEYDEEAIKKQLNHKTATNLKVYKFQLEQLLLKSLLSHQHFSTQEDKIRNGIAQFDILLQKGLFEMAQKQLEKVKSISLKSNHLAYFAVIREKEAKLQYLLTEDFYPASTSAFPKTQAQWDQLLNYQNTLHHLYTLIGLYLEKRPTLSSENIRQLRDSNAFTPNKSPRSPKEDLLLRLSKQIKESLLGKDQGLLKNLKDILHEFRIKKYTHQLPEIYCFSLRCLAEASLELHDWNGLSNCLNRGLNFSKKQPELTNQYFYFAAYEIQYQILTARNPAILEKILHKHPIPVDNYDYSPCLAQAIYFSWISIAGIVLQKYELADEYLARLTKFPQESVSFAPAIGQILSLIMLYEKMDFPTLQKRCREIKTKFSLSLPRQEKQLYSSCLQFFEDLSKGPKRAPELVDELVERIKTQEESPFHRAFYQLGIHSWLSALVYNEPFIA